MNRKNFHEYLFSLPASDDSYTNYRQAHKKCLANLQLRTTQTEVIELSEKALTQAIKEFFNTSK